MKKIENLIEKKDSINTFKKFKFKNYLNKSFLKKKSFFFFRFRSRGVSIQKVQSQKYTIKLTFRKIFQLKNNKINNIYRQETFLKKSNFLKSLIIFL